MPEQTRNEDRLLGEKLPIFSAGVWTRSRIDQEADRAARAIFDQHIKGQLGVIQTDENA